VDDETGHGRPDVRGNRGGQHRRDDQIRVETADRVPHHLVPQGQLDRDVALAVGEFGMYPLRHAVVGAGNKQDPHRRSPSWPFLAGACQAGVDTWLRRDYVQAGRGRPVSSNGLGEGNHGPFGTWVFSRPLSAETLINKGLCSSGPSNRNRRGPDLHWLVHRRRQHRPGHRWLAARPANPNSLGGNHEH
jgi:hypothetical protein